MIFDISQFDGFHDAKIPNLKDFATQKFPISRGQDLFPNRWKKTLEIVGPLEILEDQ